MLARFFHSHARLTVILVLPHFKSTTKQDKKKLDRTNELSVPRFQINDFSLVHEQYAVTVHYTLGNRTHTKTRALTFHFQNSCKSFALRLFIMSKCIRWNFLAKNDWMHGCFCLLLLKSNARDIYPRYAIYRQWIRKMLIAAFIRARLSFHNLFIIQVFRWKKNCTHTFVTTILSIF